MQQKNFAILDGPSLPGGIPLDPIEVIIERVTEYQLQNPERHLAILDLLAKAKEIKANVIYDLRHKHVKRTDCNMPLYDVIYSAKTCRMANADLP